MAKFLDKFFGNSNKSELTTKEETYINLEKQKEKEIEQPDSDGRKAVELELSLNSVMETTVSDFQREFIEEELEELPPVLEGDINIATTYIFDIEDKFEIGVYFRNGLDKSVNLELVPLNIVDKSNEIVAVKVFDLKELGIIPAMSARPFKLYFEKEIVKVQELNMDHFKIAFDDNIKVRATVDIEIENIPENINPREKHKYLDFLNKLPAIGGDEIAISTYGLTRTEEGNLDITILIRNATLKGVILEKLPIIIKTKDGQEVAGGTFNLQDQAIRINPRKAVLHRLIFPAETLVSEDFDVTECEVIFAVNN